MSELYNSGQHHASWTCLESSRTERCGQLWVINFANFQKKIHILHEAARVLNLYSNVCDKSAFFIKLVKSEAAGLLADHTR